MVTDQLTNLDATDRCGEMKKLTAYGYGDSQTFVGRTPYDDEPEAAWHCNHCDNGMEDDNGEWGEWCSQECWHKDNGGSIKKWILAAIGCEECITIDEVELHLLARNDFDLNQYTTPSTYARWKRAIQSEINNKAATFELKKAA